MKRSVQMLGVVAVTALVVAQAARLYSAPRPEPGPQGGTASAKVDRAADEAAIRASVAAFVKAYNAHDAKAVAMLFSPEGVIMSKNGQTVEGRAEIEKTFARIFAESPKRQTAVEIETIRFLGPDLAVETGVTKEVDAPSETPEKDRYTVLHVKRNSQWLMAMARDVEGDPPSAHENLQPLAWMVGEWVEDGGSIVVHATCRWSDCGNFLLQDYRLQVSGKEGMKISQRIGWDPASKQIRSWVFDSQGGFGESVWTRQGSGWLIKSTGVRGDGALGSSTNTLVPTGPDGYVYRVMDRVVGGELMPPTEVKVVRKAPQPK